MNDPFFDDDAIDEGIAAMEDEYDPEDWVCQGCGCSGGDPCPGGCVWATPELSSRCV
jgi:hypothetical protein